MGIAKTAIGLIALLLSSAPVEADTFVSCIRPASEITFRAQRLGTILLGTITNPEETATGLFGQRLWVDGEFFLVGKVKILELGDVPPDTSPPAVGSVVNLLEREPCEVCDPQSAAKHGLYTRAGEIVWLKSRVGALKQRDDHGETIENALVQAGVSYQFVLRGFCDVSTNRNWSEAPD